MTQSAAARKAELERITVETPNFYMRLLRPEDATDRSGAWFEQPEVYEGLNLEPGIKTRGEMRALIKSYDQYTNRINGMFDKRNGLLVTIANTQFNWDIKRVMLNVVVGEPEYRHRGVVLEAIVPARDYYFEEMDMRVMTATALSSNKPVISLLENTGSTRDQTLKNYKVSKATGRPVDLYLYSITRDAWRAWKKTNAEMVEIIRDCSNRLPELH